MPGFSPVILDALDTAVPAWMARLAGADRRLLAGYAATARRITAAYCGGPMTIREGTFAQLARGLAAAALAPGGTTLDGRHWCARDGSCPDGTRHDGAPCVA